MKPSSLLHAAVPIVIAAAALLLRELTRPPHDLAPPPGTPRTFAPPAGLVRAALTRAEGELRVRAAAPGRISCDAPAWSGREPELERVLVLDGSLDLAPQDGPVALTLELEVGAPDARQRLDLAFEAGTALPSLVPGVRGAELRPSANPSAPPLHLHWIALENGDLRGLLVGPLQREARAAWLALELAIERP